MENQKATELTNINQIVGGVSKIKVSGYKSLYEEQKIEIRPLTILAGANSSGKSSIMQPLLLLKQTLEANYDPGALLLNGPHIKFTSAEQLLSKKSNNEITDSFYVGIELDSDDSLFLSFQNQPNKGFDVQEMKYINKQEKPITLRSNMTSEEINSIISTASITLNLTSRSDEFLSTIPANLKDYFTRRTRLDSIWTIKRDRCFLRFALKSLNENDQEIIDQILFPVFKETNPPIFKFEPHIRKLIRLPGIRGNPERTYPTTAVGSNFPGIFQQYVASIIAKWQAEKDEKLDKLNLAIEKLGLSGKIIAKQINDTQVELHARRLHSGVQNITRDMVNIADVGFGVSQTLPILVALITAEQGQLVYLEQPEIHLHPRAQIALAEVLADAAKRGVRVVSETHSALLLLAVQSLVADGSISPELVKLHWFTRKADGATEVSSADLDKAGAFGDWPEDFADVSLEIESRYLDAVESRQRMR